MGAKHSPEAKAKPKPWRGWLSGEAGCRSQGRHRRAGSPGVRPSGENVLFMARWAELPVLRARFQRSKVSKLKGEEQNRESDGLAAPFWLWTDTNPGEGPGSCHFYFGGRSGTSGSKPGGGTSCLEGTRGRGLVGSGGRISAEFLLPAFQSRGDPAPPPPLLQSGTEALGGRPERKEKGV